LKGDIVLIDSVLATQVELQPQEGKAMFSDAIKLSERLNIGTKRDEVLNLRLPCSKCRKNQISAPG